MRPIVFVSEAAALGGAELLAADLASALARAGRDVRFAAPPDAPGLERLRARLGRVPLAALPLRNKAGYALRALGAALDVSRLARLAAGLRALDPAALIVNLADPEDGRLPAAAARTLRVPPRVVALLHQPAELPRLGVRRGVALRTALARESFALFDRVVTVSEASAAEARAAWGLGDRVIACAAGIPLPDPPVPGEREHARAALGVTPGAALVVAIGRLSPEKGLCDLVDAAASLARDRPDAVFVVAGEGGEADAVRARARAAGLGGTFRLLGWQEPRRVLAAADVLALPSRLEGLPLAILEAGALGVDVVASAVGGVPEVLEEGALVRPGDPAALAAALRAALLDPAARRARAGRLRERVLARHSIEAMAERFARVLP